MSNLKAEELKSTADSLFRQGSFTKALGHYTRLILLDKPNAHIYHSNRALCYLKLKKPKDALADAEICIRLKPDFFKGHVRRAFAMFDLSNLDDALASLWKAIQLESNSPDYLPFIANCILNACNDHDPFSSSVPISSTSPFQSHDALHCISYAVRNSSSLLASKNILEASIMFLSEKISSAKSANEFQILHIFKTLLIPQSTHLTITTILFQMYRFLDESEQKVELYAQMKGTGLFVTLLKLLPTPVVSKLPVRHVTDILRVLKKAVPDDAFMIELFMKHDAAKAVASIFALAFENNFAKLYCAMFIHQASLLNHDVRIKLRDAGLINLVYNDMKHLETTATDIRNIAFELLRDFQSCMLEAATMFATYSDPFLARINKFDEKIEEQLEKEQGYDRKRSVTLAQSYGFQLSARFLGNFLLSESFWTEDMAGICGWRGMIAALHNAKKDTRFGLEKLKKLNQFCWPRLLAIFGRESSLPDREGFFAALVGEGAVAPGFKLEFAKDQTIFRPLLLCMGMLCAGYASDRACDSPALRPCSSVGFAKKMISQYKSEMQSFYRKIATQDILGHYRKNAAVHMPLFQFARVVLLRFPAVVMDDIFLKRPLWELLVDVVQPCHGLKFLNDIWYFEVVFQFVKVCTFTDAPGTSVQKFAASIDSSSRQHFGMRLRLAAAEYLASINLDGSVVPIFFQPLAQSAIHHLASNEKELIMDVFNWIVETCEDLPEIIIDGGRVPINIDFEMCPAVEEFLRAVIARYPQDHKKLKEKISEANLLAQMFGVEVTAKKSRH